MFGHLPQAEDKQWLIWSHVSGRGVGGQRGVQTQGWCWVHILCRHSRRRWPDRKDERKEQASEQARMREQRRKVARQAGMVQALQRSPEEAFW